MRFIEINLQIISNSMSRNSNQLHASRSFPRHIDSSNRIMGSSMILFENLIYPNSLLQPADLNVRTRVLLHCFASPKDRNRICHDTEHVFLARGQPHPLLLAVGAGRTWPCMRLRLSA